MSKIQNINDLFQNFFLHNESRSNLGFIEQKSLNMMSNHNYKIQIESIGIALINIGVQKGTKIGIYLPDSLQSHIIDMACMIIGAITIHFYSDSSSEEICRHLEFTDSEILFLSKADQLLNQNEILSKSKIRFLISLEESSSRNIPMQTQILNLKDLKILGQGLLKSDYQGYLKRCSNVFGEDIATFVLTSGTTDDPKFVMISHRAYISTLHNLEQSFLTTFGKNDRTLQILPLSHVMGKINSLIHLVFYNETIFSFSRSTLVENLTISSPTCLLAFPKILKQFYYRLKKSYFKSNPLLIDNSFNWADGASQKYFSKIDHDLSPSTNEILQRNLAYNLIYKRIHNFLGGRLKLIITGGGILSEKVFNLFRNSNILVLEGYGLTETCGPCVVNPPYKQIPNSVGLPIKNNQIKLSPHREILIKTQSIFSGYYKVSSQNQFDGEFFYTGDLGEFTRQGYLKYLDRKSHCFHLPDGQIIYPQFIESDLEENQFISHALVTLLNNKITAVLAFDPSRIASFFQDVAGPSPDTFIEMVSNPHFRKYIFGVLKETNAKLSKLNKIESVILTPFELTIENLCLTHNSRARREQIIQQLDHLGIHALNVP